MQKRADEARKKQELAIQKAKFSVTSSFLGSLASLVGSSSKKSFEMSKRLARAQTLVNTAAMAIAAGKDTPGPWYVKAAAVGAALIAGGAQLANINRTTFGDRKSVV